MTAERLRELLHYDPETGVFTWRQNPNPRGPNKTGRKAGTVMRVTLDLSYVSVTVGGETRRAHVWAFLWVTGQLPSGPIDHINHNGVDNRWANLRPCTQKQNLRHMRLRRDNTSGYIGVHKRRCNGRFLAYNKTADGRRVYLGHYATAPEAARVRDVVARREYGEFAVLNFPSEGAA